MRPCTGAAATAISPAPVNAEVVEDEVADIQMEMQESQGAVETSNAGVKRSASILASTEHVRKTQRVGASPVSCFFSSPAFAVRDCGPDGSCGFACSAIGSGLKRGSKWEDMYKKRAALGATPRVPQHIGTHESTYKPLWNSDLGDANFEKEG